MRSGFFFCLTGPMLLALAPPALQAQSPTTTPLPPEPVQAPTPASTVPVPKQQMPGAVPSRPAYDPDAERAPKTMPPPVPAPPPVVVREAPAGKPKYTERERFTAYEPYIPGPRGTDAPDHLGSPYIPVDSWVYPELMRLYGMGYLDTAFLSLRPWTRRSILHMLQASEPQILGGDDQEAQAILAVLLRELGDEAPDSRVAGGSRGFVYGTHSIYTRLMGIGGTTLRDSYHLGQTIVNDYGRPYEPGFNTIVGASTIEEFGRFSLHVRGEYQQAPAAPGYSTALATTLSQNDGIPYAAPNLPQATISAGPIDAQNPIRLVEATLSFHLLGHEISGGKSDAWLGPAMGGGMAWSNNAENIYSFRINRVEPLYIPLVSRALGPIRYDFFYGSLKGHTEPNHPWVHSEMIGFAPTKNFQFGFQRTIIFGGAGHEPVTLHSFFKGFFSVNDTNEAVKFSAQDPGARFTAFNFSYRLPFVRKYLTLYTDSETHDDVFPVSAPRRATYRPGLYLSQIPMARKLDLRVEGVSTDCSTLLCLQGGAQYIEVVQKQGYTNKGFLLGDWIGREAKGGQAWLTYHLSGNEWVQLSYLNKKNAKDFIPGGTTQNSFTASVVKRVGKDIEINAWVQHEMWKAPIYLPGAQSNTTGAVQLTWFPKLHTTGSTAP